MTTRGFALLLSAAILPLGTLQAGAQASPSAPIRGQYIVVFKDSVKDPQAEVRGLNAGGAMRVKFVYDAALKGFAAEIPDAAVTALRRNPRVDYIEQDQSVSVQATQSSVPSWGLDRVDQVNNTFNKTYNYNYDGTGVTAYVIDTGIRSTHQEFKTAAGTSRVQAGYSVITGGTADCNGHGTHVAGTLGGKTVGVAKNVSLVPVRVMDCAGSGSWSGIVAGVNWMISNAAGKKAVANISIGGGTSSALDTAVQNAINAGIVFVASAGNDNKDASLYSPARVAAAITVGATSNTDTRASYSNYGPRIDIFAPGTGIYSAWYASDTGYKLLNGTSMAAPHVAGSVALLLQEKNLGVSSGTPAAVVTQLLADSQTNLVLNTTGNPNNFLNTNYRRTSTGF